ARLARFQEWAAAQLSKMGDDWEKAFSARNVQRGLSAIKTAIDQMGPGLGLSAEAKKAADSLLTMGEAGAKLGTLFLGPGLGTVVGGVAGAAFAALTDRTREQAETFAKEAKEAAQLGQHLDDLVISTREINKINLDSLLTELDKTEDKLREVAG